MTFYLNNSSLPWLTCAKQYHLRVVQRPQPTARRQQVHRRPRRFHKMMQLVGTSRCPSITSALLFNFKSQHQLPPFPEPLALQYAQLAQQIYDEHQEMFSAERQRGAAFRVSIRGTTFHSTLTSAPSAPAPSTSHHPRPMAA